jgi:hypothetical protein
VFKFMIGLWLKLESLSDDIGEIQTACALFQLTLWHISSDFESGKQANLQRPAVHPEIGNAGTSDIWAFGMSVPCSQPPMGTYMISIYA